MRLVRNTNRKEGPRRVLVCCQELFAGDRVVVDDVESLSIHTGRKPGKDNRFSAVVHKRQRQLIRSAEMNKESKGIDAYAPA